MIYIGIDPGVKTGFAINSEIGISLFTGPIHEALDWVLKIRDRNESEILVRFEDARLRTYFGNSGREKLQGAGSVKRDCKIWEDFLTDHKIKFEKVSPKAKGAKVTAEYFKKLTGYDKLSSQHARDAAMLIVGLK